MNDDTEPIGISTRKGIDPRMEFWFGTACLEYAMRRIVGVRQPPIAKHLPSDGLESRRMR